MRGFSLFNTTQMWQLLCDWGYGNHHSSLFVHVLFTFRYSEWPVGQVCDPAKPGSHMDSDRHQQDDAQTCRTRYRRPLGLCLFISNGCHTQCCVQCKTSAVTPPCLFFSSSKDSPGDGPRLWRRGRPVDQEPRDAESVAARLRLWPAGLWQELQAPLPLRCCQGRGAVCQLYWAVEAVCGPGEHDSAGTQSGGVPGCLLCHPVPF